MKILKSDYEDHFKDSNFKWNWTTGGSEAEEWHDLTEAITLDH